MGTPEAAQVLKAKIDEKKINRPDEIKRAFLGLASVSRPTADHIDTCWVSAKQRQPTPNAFRLTVLVDSIKSIKHYKINEQQTVLQNYKNKMKCEVEKLVNSRHILK